MKNRENVKTKKNKKRLLPMQIVVLGFFIIILTGTALLMLPISSVEGRFTDPLTSLFTATSATCVTGLSVVTTSDYWSIFGKTVIILMIQTGGLGFLSMTVLISALFRRRMSPRENMLVAQSVSLTDNGDTFGFMKRILAVTFSIEGIGALILMTRFIPKFGAYGIYVSVFHAISAFCNAGFDLIGADSLMSCYADPVIIFTHAALIFIGGIGFMVWESVREWIFKKKHLSVYAKFVLTVSVVLLVLGFAVTAVFEWNNVTMENMNTGEKLMASFFHSVSLRTAGFGIFDNGMTTDPTHFVSIILMFIGGATGSTAGGVKVSTFGIVIYSTFLIAMGNSDIILFKRKINNQVVLKAVALLVIAVIFTFGSAIALTAIEGIAIEETLYETVSAYATVGLSTGITSFLSMPSKLILIALMYMGRVGILTITYSFMIRQSQKKAGVNYSEAPMPIG